ncbi:MAG: DUF488 domain-containing protein [Pseudomonadota bacterium]|nr:DUF488 domain-containing protein [Pseudomonadota bacterium]
MANPFFTIGHSTRSLDEFVDLLRASDIQVLVDVRTIPRSRRNPQFNKDALPDSLQEFQIGYEHMIELGGRRGKQPGVEDSPNTFWTHESFRNYADYAMGPEFRAGLARLRELGHRRRCAIMCAEAVWWRCHRRLIADYLLAAGETVLHILGPDKVEPAELTPEAQRQGDGTLVYPGPATPQYALPLDKP